MRSARRLYLPVEGLARELDGKLLLALIARERGWEPVIGYKNAIRDRRALLRPGIFLSHNARRKKPDIFRRLAEFGHQTVVLDEEALVRQTDEIFLMKHEPGAFDRVRLVMAWGEDDAALWRGSGWIGADRVAVTGNPRMDVLRPELRAFHQPEIDAIRAEHGDYVLVNTNFATINHFVPERSTLIFADTVGDHPVIEEKARFLAHKTALFERFLALMPGLARAIAPLRLVIRPHPSELHRPWIDAVAGVPNAAVVAQGSVVPWIAGARALIHNGCTSAVESAVVGTPVLTYRPVRSEAYDNPLPNGVGVECFGDGELIEALKACLEAGPRPLNDAQRELLEHHLAAASGPLSCERIIDALDRLPDPAEGAEPPGPLRRLGHRLDYHRRIGWRRLRDGLSAGGRTRRAYIDRKMSELTPAFMDQRVARFQAALGRFEGRRARRLAGDLFAIE